MKSLVRALVTILALLGVYQPLFATTHYVDKAGNDANSCSTATSSTPANAKLTIAAGNSCTLASDTLIIGDGLYFESLRQVVLGGTVGNPTIIKARNRNQAILRPTGGNFVVWSSHDNITWDGLVLDAVNTISSPFYAALQLNTVVQHSTIENGHGDPSSSSCILGGGAGSMYLDNDVFNCSTSSNQDHGIYTGGSPVVIDGNRVRSNGGYGIHTYPSGSGDRISNNIVYSNGVGRGDTRCIGSYGADNFQIYNNVCYSNGSTIEVVGNNNVVYHNTLFGNTAGSFGMWIHGGTGNIVRNNIVFGNTSDVIQDDCGCSTISNNTQVDPSFVNSAGANFAILTGSAAKDAGSDTTLGVVTADIAGVPRPQGLHPDNGAYEFIVAASGTPPLDSFIYTTAADLNGQNGGSINWLVPWAKVGTNTITVALGPAGSPDGGNAAFASNSGGAFSAQYSRTFGGVTAATIPWYVYISTCSPASGSMLSILQENGTDQIVMRVSGGNFQAFVGGGTGYTTVAACTANQWHRIDADFDASGHANQFRVKIDSGTYSSYFTVANSTYSSINGFSIFDNSTDAHSYYLDGIGVNVCAANKLGFTTQPNGSAQTGQTIGTMAVSVLCADGATVVTTATDSITLSKHAGVCTSMTLNGTNPVSAVQGVATFSGINMTVATGTCSLDAAASGLTGATSSTFTITAPAAPSTSGSALGRAHGK